MAATGLTWMLILCKYDLQCIPYRFATWYALMRGWKVRRLTQAQYKVECGLLLDVVVREGATILQLLAGENETLLVRGNAFLVLDLLLYVLDRVRTLAFESDCFTGECLYEDLHVIVLYKIFFYMEFSIIHLWVRRQ
jgi:hypothetical protein